jgi:multimeric flavodoxin WrbA
MSKILVINGSSRENGNTEMFTSLILKDVPHQSIHLRHHTIVPIVDKRHSPEGFTPVEDDYDSIIQSVLAHDILVFATPLYWYGMSGHMKLFVDRWSQSLRDPRFDFKKEMSKKKSFVIICGGDNPSIKALPLVQQFQHIFDYVGTEFIGYAIGKGNSPGEIMQDQNAMAQAKHWNHYFQSL